MDLTQPRSVWTARTIDAATYRGFANVAADRHGLGRALVCAVCEQESGKRNTVSVYGMEDWDTNAVRFEPGFQRRYIKGVDPQNPTTEQVCLSMSFGLMQIMGLTARHNGFSGRFLTELCDPETGLEFGCRFLRVCVDLAHSDAQTALLRWNGGADDTYPASVMARMAKFS